ncbi:MAG: phosphoribosylaminoimidazolesuccinocarboxamide synthase [Flavobacteriales bacterium]|nr:phosphoribosylaminoimidazolesuccinocarboxamide synthase [Bacteroidota bacterium]MCB9239815.1 phosphoribosylaminoimidazolesuccinocarboxamide synthase [Flavobacteriales bacterium]
MESLVSTNYYFRGQRDFYRGKVRDVYNIDDNLLVMIATDRISAFDHVLPHPIPYKGQVLNQIASTFLDDTSDLVPNWKIAEPDPHVTVGYRCDPIPVEMVVRGYLAGHAWRIYRDGGREICGEKLPDGLRENDRLPTPIITPTTKAKSGHDTDISFEELYEQKVLKKRQIDQLVQYALTLFEAGSQKAADRNLILVDTKYEFGIRDEKILLIDEIHTPDSSRYFYRNSYEEIQAKDQQQRQLSKEFVRKWLIENGFQGLEGQLIPEMTPEFIESVSNRYIELYEQITGKTFVKRDYHNIGQTIEEKVNAFISQNLQGS